MNSYIEVNQKVLQQLKESFPGCCEGINIENNSLTYNGQHIDVSRFSLYNVINDNANLYFALDSLKPAELFNIIRIYALYDQSLNNTGGLISIDEFSVLVNSNKQLDETETNSVNRFYNFLGDLVRYEPYLNADLIQLLNFYRSYTLDLQVRQENGEPITPNQTEAIKRSVEMESKVNEGNAMSGNSENKGKAYSLRDTHGVTSHSLTPENISAGYMSIALVLALIVIVAIILTVITFIVI